jgi:hypothetical protein
VPEYALINSPEVEEARLEHAAEFIRGIKLGLAAYAMGRLTSDDELARNIFAEAVTTGSIEQYDSVEPIVRNYAILRWMSMIRGPLPTWRRFYTALPTKGIGYGMINKARCYRVDPYVPEPHRHVRADVIRGQACDGLLRQGICLQSSTRDVVHAVYAEKPPTRLQQYVSIGRYHTQFDVLTDPSLGGPRRLCT